MRKRVIAALMAICVIGSMTGCGTTTTTTTKTEGTTSEASGAFNKQKAKDETEEVSSESAASAEFTAEGEAEAQEALDELEEQKEEAENEADEAANDIDYFNSEIGALFTGDKLIYGPASLEISGLHKFTSDDDPSMDYLVNDDYTSIVYVNSYDEDSVPIEETTEEEIKASYEEDAAWTNVNMLSFDTFELGDYPCVLYSFNGNVNGTDEYGIELIMGNDNITTKSMRIIWEATDAETYAAAMTSYTKTLELCGDKSVYENREAIGAAKIAER